MTLPYENTSNGGTVMEYAQRQELLPWPGGEQ